MDLSLPSKNLYSTILMKTTEISTNLTIFTCNSSTGFLIPAAGAELVIVKEYKNYRTKTSQLSSCSLEAWHSITKQF